jgi:hypothetical protein
MVSREGEESYASRQKTKSRDVSVLALPIAAMATPGAGFVFNFFNRFTSTADAIHEHAQDNGWSVELEVEGATDFVQQDVMLAPGDFSGWHSPQALY